MTEKYIHYLKVMKIYSSRISFRKILLRLNRRRLINCKRIIIPKIKLMHNTKKKLRPLKLR